MMYKYHFLRITFMSIMASWEKREEIRHSRMTCIHKRQTVQVETLDYTTITDRLRTIIWGDNSHSTGVVNLRLKGPIFPFLATVMQSEGQISIYQLNAHASL